MKISELIKYLDKMFPLNEQAEFDNSGLQIDFEDREITNVLVSLDPSIKAINYAIKNNCNLLITHHPLMLFREDIIDDDLITKNRKKLLKDNNICLYAMHTNFDVNDKGLAFTILKILSLDFVGAFEDSFGVIGDLQHENTFEVVIKDLSKSFNSISNRCFDSKKKIKRIAYINGSGGRNDYIYEELLNNKVDLFITSEMKHSLSIALNEVNISFIELTHYDMEKFFIKIVKEKLNQLFSDLQVFTFDTIPYN